MRCARCGNEDSNLFYKGSRGYYCRACISFKRQLLLDEVEHVKVSDIVKDVDEISLSYELTVKQKKISRLCAEAINYQDVLLHCVCGAGKTELTLESISNALKKKQKVGFAISRRQVVIEIKERLSNIFKEAKVICVCSGYTNELDGDLIVLTTHQLYRYHKVFDLLILDESDAFPYKGNKVLKGLVDGSLKGHIIYTTATIDNYLKKRIKDNDIKYLTLNERPHGHPLPIPKLIVAPSIFLYIKLISFIEMTKYPLIIFTPTIKLANSLYWLLKWRYKCNVVTSKSEDLDVIVNDFKQNKYQFIIATTILERGVTIPCVDIIVLFANHVVFDEASLIQIIGRMGRSSKRYEGNGLLLCNEYSQICINSIKELERLNAMSFM